MTETSFQNKLSILAELWISHRDDEEYEDFIEYNDLGLPLAYCLDANLIKELDESGIEMIEDTWDMLLGNLGIEDAGWESYEEMMDADYEIPVNYIHEDEDEDDLVSEREQLQDQYDIGFLAGVAAEQKRIQEIVVMQKRWAKENRKGNEFLFWDGVGEVLTPIEIDYSDDAYRKSLEQDGF